MFFLPMVFFFMIGFCSLSILVGTTKIEEVLIPIKKIHEKELIEDSKNC